MNSSDEFDVQVLDNGSVTDTLQWCQLHMGHCPDVVPIRRHFEDPSRQDEIFLACQKCIRELKKAELIGDSKYAKMDCYEVTVPRALSKGESLATRRRAISDPSQQQQQLRLQSYEVKLDALQVKYLRALGLRVIPA